MTLREQLGRPVLFHVICSHGKDGPSLTGYDSRNPNVISRQLDAMNVLGGPDFGVILLTYGPFVSPFIHQAVMGWVHQCSARNVKFALCFDPWTVKAAADKNAAMLQVLQHADTQFMLGSRSYLPGRPVLDFSTGVDSAAMASPDWSYWVNGKDFDWPRFPSRTSLNNTPLPCAYRGFNDGTGADRNKSIWDSSKLARVIDPRAGSAFWNLAASAKANPSKYVQWVTWNDVQESTEIESFASMLSGRIE